MLGGLSDGLVEPTALLARPTNLTQLPVNAATGCGPGAVGWGAGLWVWRQPSTGSLGFPEGVRRSRGLCSRSPGLAVEALFGCCRSLPGAAGLGEERTGTDAAKPPRHSPAGELGAIVRARVRGRRSVGDRTASVRLRGHTCRPGNTGPPRSLGTAGCVSPCHGRRPQGPPACGFGPQTGPVGPDGDYSRLGRGRIRGPPAGRGRPRLGLPARHPEAPPAARRAPARLWPAVQPPGPAAGQ